MEDSVFGRIAFEQGVWIFIPAVGTKGFMVTIVAPASGPSDMQRDCFRQIRSRLAAFQHESLEFIQARLGASINVARLSIYSVEIGADEESRHGRFTLEFSDSDAAVIHRISFDNSRPMGYAHDD